MVYTVEHLVAIFIFGLLTGVVSTVFFTKKELTLEAIISLLIMSIWLALHVYGFFFDKEVPWVLDFAGFGAAGNFIGVTISDLKMKTQSFIDKIKTK